MKATLTSVACALTLSAAGQLSPTYTRPLIQHLEEVNKEWRNRDVGVPPSLLYATAFAADVDRIQCHLLLVEAHLRANTPHTLSPAQLSNRMASLDELRRYALARTFPTNTRHACRQPYFIDDYGVACAVGQLIIASGNTPLAETVRSEMNYAYIREMPYPELRTWADVHGFTPDELAWIQPTYAAPHPWEPLGGGLNGPVIVVEPTVGGVVIAGAFTDAGGVACENVVLWNGGFQHIGNLTGDVWASSRDYVSGLGSVVFVGGSFVHNSTHFDLAMYANGGWSYMQTLPGKMTTVTAIYADDWSGNLAAGYYDEGLQRVHYVARFESGSWNIIGTFNGPIHAIAGNTVAGDFTALMNGQRLNRVAEFNGTWTQLGDGLDNTVYCLEHVNSSLYAGGKFFDASGVPTFGCAKYRDGVWQNTIDHYQIDLDPGVDSIIEYVSDIHWDGTELWIAGRFAVQSGLYYGRHLATLNETGNWLTAQGNFDGPVSRISQSTQRIVGGSFSGNAANSVSVGVADRASNASVKVFPNPMTHSTQVVLPGHSGAIALQLISMDGRPHAVDYEFDGQIATIRRGSIPAGVYMCVASSGADIIGTARLAVVD